MKTIHPGHLEHRFCIFGCQILCITDLAIMPPLSGIQDIDIDIEKLAGSWILILILTCGFHRAGHQPNYPFCILKVNVTYNLAFL